MYVTEIGAGSKKAATRSTVGEKGQAKLLKKIYKYFLKQRNKLHVEAVDWFSWQDSKTSICSWCSSSGLLTDERPGEAVLQGVHKLTGGKHRPSAERQ